MHRTQVLLDEWQYQQLKVVSEREGRSIGSLVRDAVTVFLEDSRRRPATKLAEIRGLGDDPGARGRDHDDILYGPGRRRS